MFDAPQKGGNVSYKSQPHMERVFIFNEKRYDVIIKKDGVIFLLNLYTVKCTGLGLVLENLTKGQKSCNCHRKQVQCFHDLKNFPGTAPF